MPNLTAQEIIPSGIALDASVQALLTATALKASEATLQALVDKIKLNDNGAALMVSNAKAKFRDGFKDLLDWDLIGSIGTGQSVTLGGVANGSRHVTFSSGTTPNQETIYQSKETFSPPFKFSVGATASQNITNTEFHIELVEVDDAGDLVTDAELFTAPTFNDARNGMGFYFNGTTTTSAVGKLRADGISPLAQTVAITKTQTGTNPNYAPNQEVSMLCQMDMFEMQTRTVNSAGSATGLMIRRDFVPRPWAKYAIRLRVKNLGTAPASNTDFRVYWVNLLDAARLSVDFGMSGGSNVGDIAAPVRVLTMPITAVSGTVTALTPSLIYSDTATPLGVSASFTGTSRDSGSATAPTYPTFAARVIANQAGTLYIEESDNNSTWFVAKTQAVAGNEVDPIEVEITVQRRYNRVRYLNDGVAQTLFRVTSAYLRTA